jgi:hypothetical protein
MNWVWARDCLHKKATKEGPQLALLHFSEVPSFVLVGFSKACTVFSLEQGDF